MASSYLCDSSILYQFLDKNPLIYFIRYQWLDLSSTLRTRVLTAQHARTLADGGLFHGVAPVYLTMIDSSVPLAQSDQSTAVGQSMLIPDYTSLRPCQWANAHASVQCSFAEHRNGNADDNGSLFIFPSPLCPRSALRRSVAESEALSLFVEAGIEIEFCVFNRDKNGNPVPLRQTLDQASSIRTLEKQMLPIMDEICRVLEAASIHVQHYHAEGQQDQYELTTAPYPVIKAADIYVFTREAIRNVCAKHALIATFHPWTPCTTGIHVNISLHGPEAQNSEESFLAGLLDHIDALFGFGLPLPVSYKRVGVNWYHQAVGKYRSWGTQNRQTPIRRKAAAFWEIRFADGFTNMPLFLAAIIAAGLSGVKAGTRLSIKDCTADPDSMSLSERIGLGITDSLPTSTRKSHEALLADEIINAGLGEQLVHSYVDLMKELGRRSEAEGNVDSELQRKWLMARF